MARCAKIAHREVNRYSNPHIERAWTEDCFANSAKEWREGIVPGGWIIFTMTSGSSENLRIR
jgi:hypothetical protein